MPWKTYLSDKDFLICIVAVTFLYSLFFKLAFFSFLCKLKLLYYALRGKINSLFLFSHEKLCLLQKHNFFLPDNHKKEQAVIDGNRHFPLQWNHYLPPRRRCCLDVRFTSIMIKSLMAFFQNMNRTKWKKTPKKPQKQTKWIFKKKKQLCWNVMS